MKGYQAKVIAYSVNIHTNVPLITMQLRYPRFIHAEFMTHRMFSRNASSSRAIPIAKLIDDVEHDPVFPISWGTNKPGMQAGQELDTWERTQAQDAWASALNDAIKHARKMKDMNVHKQIVNRILEPYAYISVIVTATEWKNFFDLRISELAQPEIRHLAELMKKAQDEFDPDRIRYLHPSDYHAPYLHPSDYHAPYLTDDELGEYEDTFAMMVSAGRCARVSYLTHDGLEPDSQKDYALGMRLKADKHASPFEHQAIPLYDGQFRANFRSWESQRSILGI
jgi:hypothetical protein